MTTQAQRTIHDRPGDLRALLGDVIDHVRTLFRLELDLAREEARRAVVAVRRGLLLLGLSAALAVLALAVLVAAAVAGLATVWPVWLAAAVVGIALGAAGASLLRAALMNLRGDSLKPKATLQTIQETKQWLRARA